MTEKNLLKPNVRGKAAIRRKEILKLLIELGPNGLKQDELAQKFKVSQTTISTDIKTVRQQIPDKIAEQAEEITSIVYKKGVNHYVETGQYDKAWKLIEGYNNWLFDTGRKEKVAEKHAHVIVDWNNIFERCKE